MGLALTICSAYTTVNPILSLQPKCKCTNAICDNLLEKSETELKKAKEQIRILEEALQINDVRQLALCAKDLACEDSFESFQNSNHDVNG